MCWKLCQKTNNFVSVSQRPVSVAGVANSCTQLLGCHVALVSSQCFFILKYCPCSGLSYPTLPLHIFFPPVCPSAILLSFINSYSKLTQTSLFGVFILHVTFYIAAVIKGTFTPLLQFSLYCLSTVFSSLKLSAWNSSTHFIAHPLSSGSVSGMAIVNQVLSIEKGNEETK